MRAASRKNVDFVEEPTSPPLEIVLPRGCSHGVCLTHDIDHLGLREHLLRPFVLRYGVNILRQNFTRRFRPLRAVDALAGIPLAALGRDRWDVIGDLLAAEARAGVTSTWFAAVRKGRGIDYGLSELKAALEEIVTQGHEIGLHGQSFSDAARLVEEVETLRSLVPGTAVNALRMHYLSLSTVVLDGMERAGLALDTTVMNREDMDPRTHLLWAPRRMRKALLEIPLHVMDSTLFSVTGLALDARGALDYTRRLLARARELRRVIVINLHPNSFSSQDRDAREWYRALLGLVTQDSSVFVTDLSGLARCVPGEAAHE